MSDIELELVVKIPESRYRLLQTQARTNLGRGKLDEFAEAVLNGTPLPKGHGDIVDIETLIDLFWDGNSMEISKYDLSVIEPLIPADRS